MKRFVVSLLILCTLGPGLTGKTSSGEEEGSPITRLSVIAEKMESYKGQQVMMKLRFKSVDLLFNKISFYDEKNTDIIFDISMLIKEEKFQKDMLNLHRGLYYLVTFTVRDRGDLGYINGELRNFTPFILEKIPPE